MNAAPPFKKIALIGFGLIGGSIARAAREQGLAGEIVTTARSAKTRARVSELGIELVATSDNTVMTHTFSKIHGLAALRIGWMFGPAHIVDAVNRIRGPFNVSTPAMLAAVAAIEDTAHVQMSKAHTEKWRNWLTEEVTKLGLKVTPSVANFILIHFPLEKGRTAADADAFLTKRGLVLRALNNYRLPHALRMTIGAEEANRLVAEGLRDFVARQ